MDSEVDALPDRGSGWRIDDDALRPVPVYCPLALTSRFVTGASAGTIASRISVWCLAMNVQAEFSEKDLSTADLKTTDHVEIHVSLWRGTWPRYPEGSVIVEAERRSGDAITYHKYCRTLLDAVDCVLDDDDFHRQPELPGGGSGSIPTDREEKSLLALEIAASLLRKDRIDERQLGMESLCLLTDLKRTGGIDNALFASRAVLDSPGLLRDDSPFCTGEFGSDLSAELRKIPPRDLLSAILEVVRTEKKKHPHDACLVDLSARRLRPLNKSSEVRYSRVQMVSMAKSINKHNLVESRRKHRAGRRFQNHRGNKGRRNWKLQR